MLETLVQQVVEGGIPSSTVEYRSRIVKVQDVRFGFAKVAGVVVAALQLKEDHSGGTRSERRSGIMILREPEKLFKFMGCIQTQRSRKQTRGWIGKKKQRARKETYELVDPMTVCRVGAALVIADDIATGLLLVATVGV